jgi:hypothetical protein
MPEKGVYISDGVVAHLVAIFPDTIPRDTESDLRYLQGQQSVIDYIKRLNQDLKENI